MDSLLLKRTPEIRRLGKVRDIVSDGDRVVVAYTMRATHSEHEVRMRGVMRFVVRDAMIAQRADYWDGLTFLQQVGQA